MSYSDILNLDGDPSFNVTLDFQNFRIFADFLLRHVDFSINFIILYLLLFDNNPCLSLERRNAVKANVDREKIEKLHRSWSAQSADKQLVRTEQRQFSPMPGGEEEIVVSYSAASKPPAGPKGVIKILQEGPISLGETPEKLRRLRERLQAELPTKPSPGNEHTNSSDDAWNQIWADREIHEHGG